MSCFNRGRILYGGDPAPQTGGESTAEMLRAYTAGLPDLMKVTNAQILPNELAQLQASKQISPELSALQTQIYADQGTKLNEVGNKIADINAQAAATRDLNTLRGPGGELVKAANEAQRIADPEYYKTREHTSNALAQMFQPTTAGETEAIQRSLNRQNVQSGNMGIPSMTNVVQNAQTFGNASRDRLGQAIGMATQAMPTMRSGVDAFQQATGKSSMPNMGNAQFIGAQQGMGNQTMGLAGGFMNNATQLQNTSQQLNAQRRDSFDRAMQGVGALGSIGAGAAAGAACCFIFLEACNGELPYTVRKYRDLYYHAEPSIAIGYKRMASWLVPLMARFDFVKSLVNEIMVKPIISYGNYLEGHTTNGSQYKTHTNVWLKIWKFLGR